MKYMFGDKLRAVREKRKITLKEVAEKAGLSESLISQIERNKVSPAIDTLLDIIEILEIDLEYIFSDLKKPKIVNLVKKEKRNKIVLDKIVYEQLSRIIEKDDNHGIEAFFMTIDVDGQSGSTEYGHIGKEMGIIVKGNGEFCIGNEKYELSEGDSISFAADVPHILKNTGKTPLLAYWVITPPKRFINIEG